MLSGYIKAPFSLKKRGENAEPPPRPLALVVVARTTARAEFDCLHQGSAWLVFHLLFFASCYRYSCDKRPRFSAFFASSERNNVRISRVKRQVALGDTELSDRQLVTLESSLQLCATDL